MTLYTSMRQVLKAEKRLLMAGDYEKLKQLVSQKTTLLEKMAPATRALTLEQATEIKRMTMDNDALLNAAQRGIQAAQSQLKEASNPDFQSYSETGKRAPLARTKSMGQRI